jgi:hypothetical protein
MMVSSTVEILAQLYAPGLGDQTTMMKQGYAEII